MQSRPLRGRAAAVVAIGVAVAAGCGSNGTNSAHGKSNTSTPQRSAASFNSTDVAFTRDYIAQQTQAQAAAALVAHRTSHQELAGVADTIQRRSHDVKEMHGWLHAWHQPAATPSPTQHPSGVMDPLAEMAQLHGARFDDAWLEQMQANHTIAISSCENELAHGINRHARQLASRRWVVLRAEQTKLQHWDDSWHVHAHHP